MALTVNTNTASFNAQRRLIESSGGLDDAYEKLASGFRINKAADDAANTQISSRMTSQIQGLNQAVRNANDAISVLQSAEGALSDTVTNLQNIRKLAVQAQNGAYTEGDKEKLNESANALLKAINEIADHTEFNGKKLLDGSFSEVFAVGANKDQTIEVALTQLGSGFGASGLGLTGLDLVNKIVSMNGGVEVLAALDSAISSVAGVRVELGAKMERFQSTLRNITQTNEKLTGTRSKIIDTDYAETTAHLTREQIIRDSALTIMGQANQTSRGAIQLLQGG